MLPTPHNDPAAPEAPRQVPQVANGKAGRPLKGLALLLLRTGPLTVSDGCLVVVAHVIEDGLMSRRGFILRAIGIEIGLRCDRRQSAIRLQVLSLHLLVELLLLQLRLDQCAVIEIALAVEVVAKQVEIRADRGSRRVRRKRFAASR